MSNGFLKSLSKDPLFQVGALVLVLSGAFGAKSLIRAGITQDAPNTFQQVGGPPTPGGTPNPPPDYAQVMPIPQPPPQFQPAPQPVTPPEGYASNSPFGNPAPAPAPTQGLVRNLASDTREPRRCIQFTGCVNGSDTFQISNGIITSKNRHFGGLGSHGSCPMQLMVPGDGYFINGRPVRQGESAEVPIRNLQSFRQISGRGVVSSVGPNTIMIDDDPQGAADLYSVELCSDE